MKDQFSKDYREYQIKHNSDCDCSLTNVTLATVIDAACCLKSGKSADDEGMQAEHLLNAPLVLLTRIIEYRFSLMLCSITPLCHINSGLVQFYHS